MKISLVITDIDGTLVKTDKSLTPHAIAAVQRLHASGIHFSVCSSRPPFGIRMMIDALGLKLKFRDGDCYAAVEGDGLRLGLVAGSERIVEQPAPVFRVAAMAPELRRLLDAGARIVRPLERGPHEQRVVLQSADGITLMLTAALD